MKVLISSINRQIIEAFEQVIPLIEKLDTMEDGPEFEKLAREVDGLFMDAGAYLFEDIAKSVAEMAGEHTRIGGQADGCPPRVVQTLN